MARKNLFMDAGRKRPDEHMVLTADSRSLHRGRRRTARTKVCRPCVVWFDEAPNDLIQGVMLDLNPYGMRVRTLRPLEQGSRARLQMMRDDSFTDPLSPPIRVEIIRCEGMNNGFVDHGVRTVIDEIRHEGPVRVAPASPSRAPRGAYHRMHTTDYTVRRMGKRRG